MRVTVITDGSAKAAALAQWLAQHSSPARMIQARGPGDVARVVEAARADAEGEWTIALSDEPATSANVSGDAAMRAIGPWLDGTDPILMRAGGAELIERAVRDGAAGGEAVLDLAKRVGARVRPRTGHRGRPATGVNPFAGAGFDVCTELLLHPDREWTERALAAAARRSPFAVHRVLAELHRRGHLHRRRAATTLKEPLVLRDHLASAWRERLGRPRAAQGYLAPKGRGRGLASRLQKVIVRAHGQCLWAGPSAVQGAARLVGGPLVVYATDAREIERAGLEPIDAGVADLLAWPVLEQGILLEPRSSPNGPATNHVVTFLDLVAADGARYREAAEALWREERP